MIKKCLHFIFYFFYCFIDLELYPVSTSPEVSSKAATTFLQLLLNYDSNLVNLTGNNQTCTNIIKSTIFHTVRFGSYFKSSTQSCTGWVLISQNVKCCSCCPSHQEGTLRLKGLASELCYQPPVPQVKQPWLNNLVPTFLLHLSSIVLVWKL